MKEETIETIKKKFDNFQIIDYLETVSFFTSLVERNKDRYGVHKSDSTNQNKNVYFADGAIGSGKSTLFRNYIMQTGIEKLVFYNPEYYIQYLKTNEPFMSQYNKAKKYLWEDMKERLLTGESFIVESVFTKKEKIDFLKDIKKQGYKLNGIYVGTTNPDINIERINLRIQEGSHTIPEEKIIDRYNKSMENLQNIFDISDILTVFDNSSCKPNLLLYKENNEIYMSNNLPLWIDKFLIQKIQLHKYDYRQY